MSSIARDTVERRTVDATHAPADSTKPWLRALTLTAPIARAPDRTLSVVIDDLAGRFPAAAALISDRECFDYAALAGQKNRYAHWARAQGIAKGDVVALLMPNRPDYMAIWLGITGAGGVVSLLNSNLVGPALAHCINVAEPKHLIVDAQFDDVLLGVLSHLQTAPRIWSHGGGAHPRIDLEIARYDDTPLLGAPGPNLSDPALLVYTSGTTGLPKAAHVSHFRLMMWSHWFAGLMDTQPTDRMYNCLPMYHSVGGVVATGATLVGGGSVVLREKFSARHFWHDVQQSECTLFQYIGELCRYLLQAERNTSEAAHKLRLCCGNGLRPDVWNAFKQRFHIPQILEFYAATEGTVSLYNVEGEPGAIGRLPRFLAQRNPLALVKMDLERGEPLRDASGFCVPCEPGEAGEAIGRIEKTNAASTHRFEGYTSKADSDKKILRDAFVAGDAWYRTGDLMRKEPNGFYYFVDRLGDTFRWKGENVSTCEVSEAIMTFPGVDQATVYGVAIPGVDGRAGMATVVAAGGLDLAAFRSHLNRLLPSYARPLFLRLRNEIEVTATFKHKKSDLAGEGYDPAIVADELYFNDRERQSFVPLDRALFDRIQAGDIRL
jgi:fatty-acyl-CoA synthase